MGRLSFLGVLLGALTLIGSSLWLAMSQANSKGSPRSDSLERARALHKLVPLVDGHNDLAWQYRQKVNRDLSKIDISRPQPQLHTDIPRLRAGGVGAQFWSVYVPASMQGEEAVRATLEQIDVVNGLMRRYPETFQFAFTVRDIERAFQTGRIASLIGIEGGHSIDNSLAALRMFYKLGARYMTLTHSANTPWADSATDTPSANGLTKFGVEVIREMNWLGMLVDLSHVSAKTMNDALDVAQAPVIFSHSSARAVCDHPRNIPDDVLRRLPKNGGVAMVTFVPGFLSAAVRAHDLKRQQEANRLRALNPGASQVVTDALAKWDQANPAPRAQLTDAAAHIDHMRKVAGIDHIGLGSDFDGITSVPVGLEDVSKYPSLTAELLRRGYSNEDILKILGRNLMRVMRRAEEVSARLQKERGPSEAHIDDLDGAATTPAAKPPQ
jgi:membrane dipeptidase